MKSFSNSMEKYFEKVPEIVRKKRLFVWLFFIIATVFFVIGMGKTKFDMTVEGWFTRNDPTIVAFDDFHAQFGSEDHLFIVYKAKDGNVFSAKSLEAVNGIRESLLEKMTSLKEGDSSGLKHIVKITSLTNAPVLQSDGDMLISKKLVGVNIPTSQQELDSISNVAKSQKKFPLLYYSKDFKYGGILIETDFGAIPMESKSSTGSSQSGEDLKMDEISMTTGTVNNVPQERVRFKPTDLKDYLALMNEVKNVLNEPKFANQFDYYPVGQTAATEHDLKMIQQMGLMNVAALLIMILILLLLFRSFSAILWPIVIVVLSVIWAIGITGWLGFTVTAFIMIMIMLTLTIGIADSVHIISGYLYYRNKGQDHKTSMQNVYKSAGLSCLLTAITTIIGIMALNITPVVPIRVFSIMSALGVGLAYFFTMYLLPLMLDVWSPKPAMTGKSNWFASLIGRLIPNFSRFLEKILDKAFPVAVKGRYVFIVIFFCVFGLCLYGSTKVKVETDPLGQYPKNSSFRQSVAVVDQKMMGSHNLEIFLNLGKENAFQDPVVLKIMDDLQQQIEKKYEQVVRTSSLVDVVKDSYQKLNEGKENMYIIPSDQNVLSQTLFLFNNASPDDRRKLVSDNYDKAHISVMLHNASSAEYVRIFNLMKKDFDDAFVQLKQNYPETKITTTGMLVLLMQAAQYMTWSEIQSFGLALAVISVILLLVFGSYKAGLIALIPNLIPATLTFGLMGLLKIPLDFQTMMLAPIIIGIAVDDTVHFITRYRTEVFVDGDMKRALEHTLKETGQAIMSTALILGLGFGIMSFSSASGTANMGRFGALAIFAGLLCDMFLLPGLIMVTNFSFQRQRAKQMQSKVVEPSYVEQSFALSGEDK